MSGSPVFLDGRLAGAVAFSWPFSNEAIAGITPDRVHAPALRPQGAGRPCRRRRPSSSDLLSGKMPEDLLQRELAKLQPHFVNGAVRGVQWTSSGFGERSQGVLRQALGSSVGSAGKAAPGR